MYNLMKKVGVWNQLAINGNMENLTPLRWSGQDANISIDSNILTINGAGYNWSGAVARIGKNTTIGHKYLITFKAKSTATSTCGAGASGTYVTAGFTATTEWQFFGLRLTASQSSNNIVVYRGTPTLPLYVKEVQFFDLTDLFEAGNEPTYANARTAILAKYNKDIDTYQAYNAGSVVLKKYAMAQYENGALSKYKLVKNIYGFVPSAYQPVEYIESSGTQYIDTGVKSSQIIPIVHLKMQIQDMVVNSGLFGAFGADNTRFQIHSSSIAIGTSVNISPSSYTTYEFLLDGENLIAKMNNTIISSGFTNANGFTNNNLFVFTRNINGIAESGVPHKLYFCKIYDSSTLVRNFIPCYRKSDSVAGLYDVVNGVFYTNQGTGTFGVGNEI